MSDDINPKQRSAQSIVQTRQAQIDWLMQPGNNFCAMPYVHMAIESNGAIRPCCMGDPLKDEDGKLVSVAGKTISELLNHPARKRMIEAFDRNEQFPNCSACWTDTTKNNARVKFSTNNYGTYKFTQRVIDGEKPVPQLTWLEVKPGNRCNLKCRICGSHNSSSWTKDSYALERAKSQQGFTKNTVPAEFKKSLEYQYNEQCKWIDEVDIWCNTDELQNLELIHMMGGEPFMVPEHFELFKRIIADPRIDHSRIIIWYNTNGTYFPTPQQMEILSEFRVVQFSLSIDDVGPRFNYQRSLADWDSVKDNLIKFKQLELSDPAKWKATLDPTVSIFNIMYLDQLVETALELGYDDLRECTHYTYKVSQNVSALSKPIKDKIQQHLSGTQYKWVREAVEQMLARDDWSERSDRLRMLEIQTLDELRGESFAEVFPEMWELIKHE